MPAVLMRDLFCVCDDAKGAFDEARAVWSVGGIGERGLSCETRAQHHLGRETFEHALTAIVVGRVEAARHDLQVGVALVVRV